MWFESNIEYAEVVIGNMLVPSVVEDNQLWFTLVGSPAGVNVTVLLDNLGALSRFYPITYNDVWAGAFDISVHTGTSVLHYPRVYLNGSAFSIGVASTIEIISNTARPLARFSATFETSLESFSLTLVELDSNHGHFNFGDISPIGRQMGIVFVYYADVLVWQLPVDFNS